MTRRPLLLALLCLTLGLTGAPRLAAQGSDPLFSGFEPYGEMLLSVDGEAAPKARLYYSKRAQAFLVRSAELESPVLLDVPGRSVVKLDLLKVAERRDGSIDLIADAVLEPAGSYQVNGEGRVDFSVDGRRLSLTQNPHMLGPHSGRELLEHDAYYRFLSNRYTPSGGAVDKLRAAGSRVRVLTFFGSWCPHCREHVPLLLKAEAALDGSGVEFDYYGLPQTKVADEPEAKKYGVTGVPTSIVFVDGKEAGRIPSSGWKHPEVALADLVANPAP